MWRHAHKTHFSFLLDSQRFFKIESEYEAEHCASLLSRSDTESFTLGIKNVSEKLEEADQILTRVWGSFRLSQMKWTQVQNKTM